MSPKDASQRLSVPTCTGCESLSRWGTCEGGCREQRFDLIRGDKADWLEEVCTHSAERAARLRAALDVVAADRLDSWEQMRLGAETALRAAPDMDATDPIWEEAPEPFTVWLCPACGGVDARHECLGICTWREVEWVTADAYDTVRARALAQHAEEIRLRTLLRTVAHVHPKRESIVETGRALQAEARAVIGRRAG